MITTLRTELRNIASDKRRLRKFGVVVGVVFIALAILFQDFFAALAVLGSILVSFGIVAPQFLYYPHLFWMGIATVLGFFILRGVLITTYFLIITPVGIVARFAGHDFLEKQYNSDKETYWKPYEQF